MPRTITLRYPATCADCGAGIAAGETARYYNKRTIYGLHCHAAPGDLVEPEAWAKRKLDVGTYRIGNLRAARRLATFRKKSATLHICPDGHQVECNGTFWDGGSRYGWTAVTIKPASDFGCTDPAPSVVVERNGIACPTDPPQHGGGPAPLVDLVDGLVLVKMGTFNGRTAVPSFYATAETARAEGLDRGAQRFV